MCPNVLKAGEIFDEIGMLQGVLERIEGAHSFGDWGASRMTPRRCRTGWPN